MSERRISVFQTAICDASRFKAQSRRLRRFGSLPFFARSLLAAQYFRMRSDIARRFAGVSRCVASARLGTGSFSFAGRITLVGRDDVSECVVVDGVVVSMLAGARLRGVAGASSMPN